MFHWQSDKNKILADFLEDWTTAITVVFIAGMSVFNLLFLASLNQSLPGFSRLRSQFNDLNPAFLPENLFYSDSAAAKETDTADLDFAGREETRFFIVDSDSFLNSGNPLTNAIPTREGLIIYKTQKGDNPSRIAAKFGISLNTILWANDNLKSRGLQVGQEIIILPVTGVLYQIQESDTLGSIASQYGVSADKILRANPNLIPAKIAVLSSIIIPDTKPVKNNQSLVSGLPSLPGYFAIPTTGWNWGKLHNYNAVDIANACGTPVYAAAEGLVVESADGWNDGYGNYIIIEHPNGAKTRYAHNEKNSVSIGDYVAKGDQIAIIGNTGLTHGPTGCHLHFEVKGARNPFAK